MIKKHGFFAVFFSLLFIVSLSALVVLCFAFKADRSPPLVADSETVDFGERLPQTLSGYFVLKNQSRHPVEILRILRSCSCTSVSFVREELAPHAFTKVYYEFDTGTTSGTKGAEIIVVYVSRGDSAHQARMLPLTLRVKVIDGRECLSSLRLNVDPEIIGF